MASFVWKQYWRDRRLLNNSCFVSPDRFSLFNASVSSGKNLEIVFEHRRHYTVRNRTLNDRIVVFEIPCAISVPQYERRPILIVGLKIQTSGRRIKKA